MKFLRSTIFRFLLFFILIVTSTYNGLFAIESKNTIHLSPHFFEGSDITNKGQLYVDSAGLWLKYGLKDMDLRDLNFNLMTNAVLKFRNSFSGILKFNLKTDEQLDQNYILEFTNSEVDFIQLVVVHKNTIIWDSGITGDSKVFSSRPLNHRFFAFKLELLPSEYYELFLAFNKSNRTLTSNIYLYHANEWGGKIQSDSLFNGIFQGLFLSFICIGFLLYFFLRQLLFLYYGLYALMVFLLLFTINGYSFQYIYPNSPIIQEQATIIIQILGLVFLNLYAFKFVRFAEFYPHLNKVKNGFSIVYCVFIFLALGSVFFPFASEKNLAIVLYMVEFSNFTFLLGLPIHLYYKFRIKEALVFFISYSTVGITLFYAIFSFLIQSLPYFPMRYTLNIALFIEMFILLLFMLINYRSILKNKLLTEQKLFESQRLNQTAFIEGQEKEKRQIALNIHDNISSNLFVLKNKINSQSSFDKKEINEEIDTISKELREISHELLPVSLYELGLEGALNDLLQNYTSFFSIHLYCQDIPVSISKTISVHVFRIFQELLKNAAKHSKANNVYVQVFGEEEHIEVHYEDDGIGFLKQDLTYGIGLKSIEYRVNILKGILNIESEENKGLLINIVVPY